MFIQTKGVRIISVLLDSLTSGSGYLPPRQTGTQWPVSEAHILTRLYFQAGTPQHLIFYRRGCYFPSKDDDDLQYLPLITLIIVTFYQIQRACQLFIFSSLLL